MNRCHSCLKETKDSFCPPCTKRLFGGKKVNHILKFTRPEFNEIRLANSGRLSISGVQVKYSLIQDGKDLALTGTGGQFIIKPIPYGSFEHLDQVPANEHISMQIALQVFKMNAAHNAIMQFGDGELTYIVKRFDIKPDGQKVLQEDFAQLANRSEELNGKNYKYDFSYEEIGTLIKKYIAAYPVEIEKFFSRVVFNYLIGNGDAHLKNFSVYRNDIYGDYTLTPAYDLINTNLHLSNEADTALELFNDGYMTENYKAGSKYTRDDFILLGFRLGIKESRVIKILDKYKGGKDKIEILVNNSFLKDELKEKYLNILANRRDRISR